jgi:quercetin dioxygenase-like cupin family protein
MKRLATTTVCAVAATATLLAAQAAPPDAVAADPARYSVLSENDVVQVIRVKLPAGARSVMHSHPAGCSIFYKDATLKVTSPAGEVRTHDYRAGDVTCGDAHSHLPENAGRDTEFVQIHLKNRKTFDHRQTGKSLVYPARLKAPDPIDADPTHYFVQFENDVVRLARIRVPAGSRPRCTPISPTASSKSSTWTTASRPGIRRAATRWPTKA